MTLTAAAFAPLPEGFVEVRTSGDCRIAQREATESGPLAMRADCSWPEVSPDRLITLLGRFDAYSEFIWPIKEARVVRTEADRALVYQRQHITGLADREVLLWMSQQDLPPSGRRYQWTAASDQPLTLQPGAVRTPRNDGLWQVQPAEGGGAQVVHQIAVEAGGPALPRWLLTWIRTRGFLAVMADVRRAAS